MSDQIVQQIKDRYEIEEVLRRYSRGVDRGDADLIRSVYHPDGTDDHGSFKGSGREFSERLIANTRGRWLASQHTLHQTNIRFDGSTAWTETYFTAYHSVTGEEGRNILETFGGRYVDRFEQREGIWAIAHRVVVHDWSQIQEISEAYPSADFECGKRSKDDLSYQNI